MIKSPKARGEYITAGELTKELRKVYLAHYFERNPNNNVDINYAQVVDTLLDFKSATVNPPS